MFYDAARSSVLLADGWGVPFAALSTYRFDAKSGRELARVRTRKAIRTMGPADEDGKTVYLLGDKEIFVHDASTLDRARGYSVRVPRYANAIRQSGVDTVALAAPNALVEYHLPTGKRRRIRAHAACAVEVVAGKTTAVLVDGSVLRRGDDWDGVGSFGRPLYVAAIDSRSGWAVALAGERPRAYDESGAPQPYAWPRSRQIHFGCITGEWRPRVSELPIAAITLGIFGEHVCAAGHTKNGVVAIATVPVTEPGSLWNVETFDGRFEGFVGGWGFLTSMERAPARRTTMTAHAFVK
jgi:hypothetical protein